MRIKPELTAINNGVATSVKLFAQRIENSKDCRILDYGCGLGRNVFYLRDKGFNIEGVDTSIQINRLRKRNIFEFKTIDSVKYLREKYDYVINSFVLNVVLDDTKKEILKDIHTKLKVGGYVFIEVQPQSEIKRIRDKTNKYEDGFMIKNRNVYTFQEIISKEKLQKLLLETGFEIDTHIHLFDTHIVIARKG